MKGEFKARQPMRTSFSGVLVCDKGGRSGRCGVGWEKGAYGMAVDVLGDRVNYDIRAVIEGILDIRGEKGIIDDDHDTVLMCDCRHTPDID